MEDKFSLSTQFEVNEVTIDGQDIRGIFQSIALYENIYSPIITGEIVIVDTEADNFVETYEIEGNEEIEFEFTNAEGQTLNFKGNLNKLKNKVIKNQKMVYAFDFQSPEMRENEQHFVTKKFQNVPPADIAKEMVEMIGGSQGDVWKGNGEPLNFLGNRKRPADVIGYALTHGVATTSSPSASSAGGSQDGETKGNTGFLCWQTTKGYRFASVDELLKNEGGQDAGEFSVTLQGSEGAEPMKNIIDYDFKEMGDYQSKLRSGAFSSVFVDFDIDLGVYTEFKYEAPENLTEKQKEGFKLPTRYLFGVHMNQRFEEGCSAANENQYDKDRLSKTQNIGRQNTFNDQTGSFVLPPHYEINAGDTFDAKISKVTSEGTNNKGYDEKHSGTYIIKQVGHHMFNDGRAYTKLTTVRSTTQQDDTSS